MKASQCCSSKLKSGAALRNQEAIVFLLQLYEVTIHRYPALTVFVLNSVPAIDVPQLT